MLERVLCPALIGRDDQLFVLEDALLAAQSGDSRFVVLGGEAGMGKTRLATEVAKRARRLGCTVLAARLQSAAAAGEILLSDEAHRRVAEWLEERGLEAVPEALALKGFDGLQQSWRLVTGARR